MLSVSVGVAVLCKVQEADLAFLIGEDAERMGLRSIVLERQRSDGIKDLISHDGIDLDRLVFRIFERIEEDFTGLQVDDLRLAILEKKRCGEEVVLICACIIVHLTVAHTLGKYAVIRRVQKFPADSI